MRLRSVIPETPSARSALLTVLTIFCAPGLMFFLWNSIETDSNSPDPSPADFDILARGDYPNPNQDFTELEAESLAIRFELRYSEISDETRRRAATEIKKGGFALLPGRSLQSLIDVECRPRLESLRARAARYSPDVLERAVPAEIRSAEPEDLCRRLVYGALCAARPALKPCDPTRLHAQLKAVDRLQHNYQKSRAPLSSGRGADDPAKRARLELNSLETFIEERARLLGDAADTALFAVQDDHSRLLLRYALFRADPATAALNVAQRVAHYRKLAASFETKHGVRLKDHDGEGRDHVARLLDLMRAPVEIGKNSGARSPQDENEAERFALIKELRGEIAAVQDRNRRRRSRAERAGIAAFESERSRRMAAIQRLANQNGNGAEQRRTALRALEIELSEKFFPDE
ncbi:MAG: hypothetical protein RIF32_00995 [Leptospirales bacterium]|jgi:hypothetical protein